MVAWLTLGGSHLLCPYPPVHHPSTSIIVAHLKANSIFSGMWLPFQWARGHALRAVSTLYQDQPEEGKWQQSYCKPQMPVMAKGTQLVKHSNCLNNFQPLHVAIDDRKWGEILYLPKEASQAIQMAEMQFEPGHLVKPTKPLCAVWKHFALEIFICTLAKRACALICTCITNSVY